MKRTINKSSQKYYLLALATLIVVFGATMFYFRSVATPLGINEITGTAYGPIELEGIIQKDSPAGVEGPYFLIVEAGSYAQLDIPNLDSFVTKLVRVKGTLSAPPADGGEQILVVDSIEVI